MKFCGVIYKVYSPSGKIYIGKTTKTLRHRRLDHISNAKNTNSALFNTKFSKAIRKYNNKLIWTEICYAVDEKTLVDLEKYFIEVYDSFKSGYNSTLGGEGTCGLKHSEQTKKRLSEINKGLKRNFSKEHKKNLSKSMKGTKNHRYGKKHSEEWKQSMSERFSGENNPNYGKKASEETKRKQLALKKGKKKSEQGRKNIAKSNRENTNGAKEYLVIHPDGQREEIRNLAKFCRLHNLNYRSLSVYIGKNKPYMGFKIYKK